MHLNKFARTWPQVTVHTNTIEGSWKHAKAHFRRMNGTKIEQFEGHLCEIMWRWWEKGSKVTGILQLIQQFYPLDGPATMTASHPIFNTWFQQRQASADDSISRIDSSDNDHDTDVETTPQQVQPSAQVDQQVQHLSSQPEPPATGTGPGITDATTSRITTTSTLLVSFCCDYFSALFNVVDTLS